MPNDAASLVDLLRRHRLLEPEQLAALAELQRQFADPRALAKDLVARRWLTTYQANQLVAGSVKNLVLGPYALLEKLGEGGMGQVFKARHRLGRVHAVKVIRKERLEKPDAIRRFQREIRAAAQLDHPHIVQAYDADEIDGTHFFSMEYVEGKDLAAVVKERGPLPVAEACEYIRQAALGLQHAFERGLVHRDIKPHNLLLAEVKETRRQGDQETTGEGGLLVSVSPCPHVKILDLGLARIDHAPADEKSSTMTQEGTVMGTPDYIAPEQAISSHEVDIRADIYSLGCTFYFLLSGRVPFPGGSLTEKLLKHQLESPRPIEEFRPEAPEPVVAVLRGMMAKKPQDRFQTPAEVVAALEMVSGSTSRVSDRSSARTLPTELDQTFASTPPESRSETMPLAEQFRQKRMAKQKAWERKFFLGLGVAGFALVFVLMVLLLRHLFGGKDDVDEPDPIAQGPSKRPAAKKPERPQTPEEEEREFQAKRAAEAEAAYPALEAKFKAPGEPGGVSPRVTFESFAKEVAAFKAKHGGTPAAIKAAARLMELPSPLDALDPSTIPEDAKASLRAAGFTPADLPIVGVLGEHRGRYWGQVYCVAYSPDGKLIASGGDDHAVHLWDAESLQELAVLRGNRHTVYALAFSPDGRYLLSGTKDVCLWNVDTKQLIRRLEGRIYEIRSICFFQDGKRALAGDADKSIILWNTETGREIRRLEGHSGMVSAVALSGDGRWAASGSHDKTARVWNVDTGQELCKFDSPTLVHSVALSPEGNWLAFGGDSLTVIDWQNGKTLFSLEGGVSVVCSSDGGRLAASLSDKSVKVWDMKSRKELCHLKGHRGEVFGVAFSPNGSRLVTSSLDGTVRLWDVESGKEVQPLTGPVGAAITVQFASDGRTLLTGHADGIVQGWNAATLAADTRFAVKIIASDSPYGFSPDGRFLAYLDAPNQLTLADMRTKDVVLTPLQVPGGSGYKKTSAIFSTDSQTLACSVSQVGISIWNVATGVGKIEIPETEAMCLRFSPDGKSLAMLTAGQAGGVVTVWDVATRKKRHTFSGIPHHIYGAAFSPDGTALATIGSGQQDGGLRVWALNREGSPLVFRDSQGGQSIAYSPDGRLLATADHDGEIIRLWDAHRQSNNLLKSIQLPGRARSVAFANDGRHLATANGNGTVYILRIGTPPPDPVAADKKLEELTAKLADAKADRETLRQEALAFRVKYAGLPAQMVRAAELLMRLPSPLDQLDPKKLPEDCIAHWRAAGREPPGELVGVLGEHLQRHWGDVRAISCGPGGKTYASAGAGCINVWDSSTGRVRIIIPEADLFQYSPDGKTLAAGSYDGLLQLWEIGARVKLIQVQAYHGGGINSLCFSPDGKTLATGGGSNRAGTNHGGYDVKLWDMPSGTERACLKGHGNQVIYLAFSSDGAALASGDAHGLVKFWRAQTGQDLGLSQQHQSQVRALAFRPDSSIVLSAGGRDASGEVKVLNLSDGKEVTFKVAANWNGMDPIFSPDRQYLACVGLNTTATLARLEDGARTLELAGSNSPLAFSSDGKTLATGHPFKLWDTATGKERLSLATAAGTCAAFSADVKTLLVGGSDGTIRLWDVESGREVQPLTGPVGAINSVAFSPDDRKILTGANGDRRLWDMVLGKDIRVFDEQRPAAWWRGVLTPDGRFALFGDDGARVELRDAVTGEFVRHFVGHKGGISQVAVSPDGRHALSASSDRTVRLWEIDTGRELLCLEDHPDAVVSATFSPDGRHVLSANAGNVQPESRLWSAENGKLLHRFSEEHGIASIAFSPDGKLAAFGQRYPQVIVRDLRATPPAEIARFQSARPSGPSQVAYHPSGTMIADWGPDGRVILWQLATRAKLREWQLPGPVHAVAFANDGRHLATANGNGTVYILRLPGGDKPRRSLSAEEAQQQQADAAKALGVPVTIENSIGMKLNLIPAGKFLMGSPENEPGRQPNEGPQHEVTITRPFYFGANEVTVGQFNAFVNETNYKTEGERSGQGASGADSQNNPRVTWQTPGFAQTDQHPVTCMSWNDAVAFCEWLSKKEGKTCRLPTEAEWEHACRAGSQTPYYYGVEPRRWTEHAWIDENSQGGTHPVGQLKANAWGLFDLYGNVWEWCSDWHSNTYYAESPMADPKGPLIGTLRAKRGNGWRHGADSQRSAFRYPMTQDYRSWVGGFRVVCEVRPAAGK